MDKFTETTTKKLAAFVGQLPENYQVLWDQLSAQHTSSFDAAYELLAQIQRDIGSFSVDLVPMQQDTGSCGHGESSVGVRLQGRLRTGTVQLIGFMLGEWMKERELGDKILKWGQYTDYFNDGSPCLLTFDLSVGPFDEADSRVQKEVRSYKFQGEPKTWDAWTWLDARVMRAPEDHRPYRGPMLERQGTGLWLDLYGSVLEHKLSVGGDDPGRSSWQVNEITPDPDQSGLRMIFGAALGDHKHITLNPSEGTLHVVDYTDHE